MVEYSIYCARKTNKPQFPYRSNYITFTLMFSSHAFYIIKSSFNGAWTVF